MPHGFCNASNIALEPSEVKRVSKHFFMFLLYFFSYSPDGWHHWAPALASERAGAVSAVAVGRICFCGATGGQGSGEQPRLHQPRGDVADGVAAVASARYVGERGCGIAQGLAIQLLAPSL